jgi:flagellar protein FlaG
MALDVSPVQTNSPPSADSAKRPPSVSNQAAADSAATAKAAAAMAASTPAELRTAIHDLQRVSEAFNRRLSFSINEKLGQVVVKVIDNDTDKVVREIPPTELQHVYERIREAIGLLFDKSA